MGDSVQIFTDGFILNAAVAGAGIFSKCLGINRYVRATDHYSVSQAEVSATHGAVEIIRDISIPLVDITSLSDS